MESRPFSSLPDFPFSPFAFNQDNTLHDLVFPQLNGESSQYSPIQPPITQPLIKESPTKIKTTISRKRPIRKGRHNKIVTAQGPRYRRMRLNLEIAPQFFDIQDMLGYDKASKTVQWLMEEAKDSIEKLKTATRPKGLCLSGGGSSKNTEASTSELESEEISISDYNGKSLASQQKKYKSKTKRASSRREVYPSSFAKELRAMARARARERTRMKKLGDGSCKLDELLFIEEKSGSKSSLGLVAEVVEQFSTSTNHSTQLNINAGRENELSVSILDYQIESIEDGIQNKLWEVQEEIF